MGRFYPTTGRATLQTVKRELRRLVTGSAFKELDLTASLQTVEVEHVGAEGQMEALLDYVRNKKARVSELARCVGCSEEDAKQVFVQRVTFGGRLEDAVREARGMGFGVSYGALPAWITAFAKALAELPKRLEAAVPDVYADANAVARAKGKGSGSAMSYVLQQAEAEFVVRTVQELRSRGVKPQELIHDGLLLRSGDADALDV
jgi:hypothetical protein